MATYSRASDVMADIATITRATPNISNFTSAIGSIRDAIIELNRMRVSDRNDTLLSFVNKARELRRADRIIAANPGVFESRSQALAWSEKAQSISRDAGENRLQAFMKQYGSIAGRNLFTQENAQLFTSRMSEIGRSPRQQRIFDYYQQFGGGASADAMDRAEEVVRAEDEARRTSEQREGRKAFAYDTMDEFSRIRHDYRDKYKSASLADAKIRRDALKKLPEWMKNLVGNSRMSTKFLFNMSKGLDHAKKIPFIGKIFDPVSMGVGLGLGITSFAFKASSEIDKANATMTSWGNVKDVYGLVSQRFMKSAMLAGIQDPRKIADLYGKLTAERGDADMFLSTIGPQIARMKPGREKTVVMKSLGFDPEMMQIAALYSGEKPPEFFRQELGNTVRASMRKTLMVANPENFIDFLSGSYGTASVGSKFIDEKDWSYWDDVVRKNDSVTRAVDSADSYQQTYNTGASNGPAVGGKTVNVTINTGALNLPNVENAQDFANDLFDFSEKKIETIEAVDPKGM